MSMEDTSQDQARKLADDLADAYQQIELLERRKTALEAELNEANDDARTANLALDKAVEAVKHMEVDLFNARASLHELKALVLIGPLTAEEWLEFRLRDGDEVELLRCCANTSAIRDDVFHLMRSYADDPILGRIPMERIISGINGHGDLVEGDHPAAVRLLELLTRMAAYYGVPMDYTREDG